MSSPTTLQSLNQNVTTRMLSLLDQESQLSFYDSSQDCRTKARYFFSIQTQLGGLFSPVLPSDETLARITRYSPNLTTVYLKKEGDKFLADKSIKGLARSCSQLSVLSFEWATSLKLTDASLNAIAEHCLALTRLSFSFGAFTDAAMANLAEKCTQLTQLTLTNCAVGDLTAKALAKNCPHLQRLFLSGCASLTNVGVDALTNQFPNLALTIDNCLNVTNNRFRTRHTKRMAEPKTALPEPLPK